MRNEMTFGRRMERGQIIPLLVLMLALFLVGFVSIATDYSNFWYHRQAVQGAADATCQAGAMDLLLYAEGMATANMNFTPVLGGSIDCKNAPMAAPCIIAKYNGYDGALPSNKVLMSFPNTVPWSASWPPGVAVPYLQVDITEQVPRYFSRILSNNPVAVHAMSSCGLSAPPGPVPIIALHPTAVSAINMSGTQDSIIVIGGPQTSIQVNSKNANAVSSASLQLIDLSKAGPLKKGGDFAVYGGVPTKPNSVNLGAGTWDYPIPPINDPYQSVSAPARPSSNGTSFSVSYGQDGCPDVAGCTEYTAGYYPSGIQVKSPIPTAIFQPGVYYLAGNGLQLQSNSIARVTCCGTVATEGDGSGGVMFYFSGTATLSVDSNSGSPGRADPYYRDGGTHNGVQSRALQCPGGAPNEPEIPATIDGNVLLAPCTGPGGDPSVGYGGPSGQYRGFLFFQDRAAAAVPSWQGGGATLIAGYMYFHQCRSDGTGLHCSAPGAGGYGTTFNMGGNPGSSSYAVGSLVTDTIVSNGNPGISMILNKNKYYPQLKVAF